MTCQGCGSPISKGRKWCGEACRSKHRRDHGNPTDSLSRIAQLLEANNIDPAEIGAVEKLRLNEWNGFVKNSEGEMEVRTMRAASLILSPSWESGPQWPVVEQARPVLIKPSAAGRKRKPSKWKTAVVLPDPQIGFRDLGELDPFHDEGALRMALSVVDHLRPDLIVNLGDLLDLPAHGKYVQEPSFQRTTQAAIDRAHRFLAEQRAIVPKAEITLHEGNHDRRLPNNILANAAASFGIRQANIPDAWPVLSVPHLLRLDELGIRYVDGYPRGESWINDRLVCRHAPAKMTSVGSSALKSIQDERVSTIYGHVHRIEMVHTTRSTRKGCSQILAASPGCLCRIDGAVPSHRASTDTKGNPVLDFPENWQQGLTVVRYQEGDAPFHVDVIPIIEGRAVLWGEEFAA